MMTQDFFNFNDAGEQKSFDVISENTVVTVQLAIRPGGAGQDGWLMRAKDGGSEHLNCEFTVVDGDHNKRKFWSRLTVEGVNHAEAIEISRKTLRAMLESARGIRPDDKSDTAKAARQPHGWQDFDQLRVVVRLGVEPPKDGYAAKNTIKEIITPDRQAWKRPEQIDHVSKPATGAPAPAQPAASPVNAVERPQWAQPAEKK
jgi:hypothetical protein